MIGSETNNEAVMQRHAPGFWPGSSAHTYTHPTHAQQQKICDTVDAERLFPQTNETQEVHQSEFSLLLLNRRQNEVTNFFGCVDYQRQWK